MSSSPVNLEAETDLHLFSSDVASDESEAALDDTTAHPHSVEGASGIDNNTAQPPSAEGASGIQEFIQNDNNVFIEKRMTYIFMLAHQKCRGIQSKGQRAISRLFR